ncbi:MAG: PD40 domain-containing protein, partial [Methanophagales archaeon]|nr:PD40 domain-containing protein [Methanophagales archaeon]
MLSRNIIVTILIIALPLSVLLSGCLKPENPTHEQGIPVVDLTNLSESITRLTINPGPDENPLWSADGKRIFFESRPDIGVGRFSPECYICVMGADGSNLTRLANGTKPVVYLDKVFFQNKDYVPIDLW